MRLHISVQEDLKLPSQIAVSYRGLRRAEKRLLQISLQLTCHASSPHDPDFASTGSSVFALVVASTITTLSLFDFCLFFMTFKSLVMHPGWTLAVSLVMLGLWLAAMLWTFNEADFKVFGFECFVCARSVFLRKPLTEK